MDDPQGEFLNKDDFEIHALEPAQNAWAYSPMLMPWLKENLHRFDAVIVHGLWLYPGYAVLKAYQSIQGKGPKLFVMPHGMLDPYFQKASNRRLKALRNWFYWKLIEEKLIHRADGILFTCEQEMLLARETFSPYKPKEELDVGYGIAEPPSFHSEMLQQFFDVCPEVRGSKYLLFLSRIHEKKGVDLLIKAYLQLKEKYPLEQLPLLVIAGPGMDTDYGKAMQQLVKQYRGLDQSVFFPGMLTGDAKWGAFYGCEAFVLPSHQENFGIAVVEALACGKPVLISDQVNIWREIAAWKGGKIASDSLAGTLDLLEAWVNLQPADKLQMGKQAKSCFKNTFGMESNAISFKSALTV